MGFDVTDYNATTGNKTGEFEVNVDKMPEPKVNTVRKVRNNHTDEVKWILPNGAIVPLKPRCIH